MTKFTKVVVIGGILALVPIMIAVHWAIAPTAPGLVFVDGALVPPSNGGVMAHELGSIILVTALIYAAAGVVIVAPAWVITQVIIFVLTHLIIRAVTPKR